MTDRLASLVSDTTLVAPVIVLVCPQMGENIGATARAMKNFGLRELRLVSPRDGWPNPAAEAMARGAEEIVQQAEIYHSVSEAVADCHDVYATSGQLAAGSKPCYHPRNMAVELRGQTDAGQRVAILFGRESTGLHGEEMQHARAVVSIPTHPDHFSLNLAQAVVVCAYEWWMAGLLQTAQPPHQPEPATLDAFEAMFSHLEQALQARGFFKTPEQKPTMLRNLRNLLLRAQPSEQEVRTLHGVARSFGREG